MRIIRWGSAATLVLGIGSLASLASVTACGSTREANSAHGATVAKARVDGKVKGHAIEGRDAIAYTMPAYQGMRILIADQGGLCGKVWKSDYRIRGVKALQIVIAEDRGAPKASGEFLINDGSSARFAVAGYVAYDDQCKELEGGVDDADTGATAGKIELTDLDMQPGGHVAGTFQLELRSGDKLSGTFDAPICTKPDTVEGAAFNPVCE